MPSDPTDPTESSDPTDPTESSDPSDPTGRHPPDLDQLRALRQQIMALAGRHHAEAPTIGSIEPLRMVVAFDDQASLVDQAALADELEDLLGVPVQVDSRRVLTARSATLDGIPL